MNMLDRGRRLSRAATGTIGAAAIAATTALGIHVWRDLQTTNAGGDGTAQQTVPDVTTPDATTPDTAAPDSTVPDDSSSGSGSVPGWGGGSSGVGPSTGGPSHATSEGS